MLAELKRYNSIGSIDGLVFLVSIMSVRKQVTTLELLNRCSLERRISINCPAAIAFMQYLEFVNKEAEIIDISEKLQNLAGKTRDEIIQAFVNECITTLTNEGIFDNEGTCFDPERGHLGIKKSAFPLAYAAVRNFLITVGVLEREINGEIGINETYESDFSSQLRTRKQKFTLADLIKKQEEQNKRGLEAEEFVLRIERNRLPEKAYKIKRISDFDVSAGYDIVSYVSEDSAVYDKLIEVKCYIGKPHFYWSENESDVARRKGNKYVLCLVDYDRIGEPGYVPEFIENPYDKIFSDSNWLVETASYKVQKI